MKQSVSVWCLLGALLAAASATAQQLPAASISPEQNAIQETARAFVQAYDAGDAQAVAALWTEDGEYVVGQTTVKGRPAIQRLYEEFFRAHPGSKMEVKIDSIRVLVPTVAIEQGMASVFNSPNGPPSSSAYTAVHVKQNGKWQMASVRESDLPPSKSEIDMQQLAWLVGDWSAQGDVAKVEVSYDWIANGNFIRGGTKVHVVEGGDAMPGALQIIGRDPLTGQFVSWFFNTDGGHGMGVWSMDGNRWMIRTQGMTADGVSTIATNILYHPDDNVLSWASVNRMLGDERLPNKKEVVMERMPVSGGTRSAKN
ncbi:MAG: SgcJ/EcaC family oxidoreductase [Pirellulales bacterium]